METQDYTYVCHYVHLLIHDKVPAKYQRPGKTHTKHTYIAALFKLVGFAAALFNSLSHFE